MPRVPTWHAPQCSPSGEGQPWGCGDWAYGAALPALAGALDPCGFLSQLGVRAHETVPAAGSLVSGSPCQQASGPPSSTVTYFQKQSCLRSDTCPRVTPSHASLARPRPPQRVWQFTTGGWRQASGAWMWRLLCPGDGRRPALNHGIRACFLGNGWFFGASRRGQQDKLVSLHPRAAWGPVCHAHRTSEAAKAILWAGVSGQCCAGGTPEPGAQETTSFPGHKREEHLCGAGLVLAPVFPSSRRKAPLSRAQHAEPLACRGRLTTCRPRAGSPSDRGSLRDRPCGKDGAAAPGERTRESWCPPATPVPGPRCRHDRCTCARGLP